MKDASLILRTLFGSSQGSFRRMRRQGYHAWGPKCLWHIDGYDIGLCTHEYICEFSRKIIWLNVYQTNNHQNSLVATF